MTPTEILKYDFEHNHPAGANQQAIINRLGDEIDNGASVVREGNTLFVFKKSDNTTIEAHSFNADPAETFVKNVRSFLKLCKKLGFKHVRTDFEDPKMTRLFAAFRPEYEVQTRRTSTGYRAVVEL